VGTTAIEARRRGRTSGRARHIPAAEAGSSLGEVSRAALVNRLRAARSQSLVTIVAPAGYGKTTLLAQWRARAERSFSFVSIDPRGTDAATLVELVADALHALGAESHGLPRRSGALSRWVWRSAVPRLAAALESIEQPFVLALDDAQGLDREAADVVTEFVRHVPEGSVLAVAGRSQPLHSLPRLRAAGDLLELTVDDLAFTRREARSLLRSLGIAVSDAQLDDVLERTEGWPAGIRLAAQSLRTHRGEVADLADYVEVECLSTLTPDQRAFVRRTSILGRLSPSLCDAVIDRDDSLRMLGSLEDSHAFVVPLDRGRHWFRVHRAVREQLQRELGEEEPTLVPELERRAAAWLEANGDPEQALCHACAARDSGHMARLVEAVASEMHNDGRDDELLTWIARLEKHAEIQDYPEVAVLAARLHAQRGNGDGAEHCLAAAICGASARKRGRVGRELAARIELVSAALCADGVESMRASAESALSAIPAGDCWRSYGLLLEGCAHALLDHGERADATLARAVHAGRRLGSRETCAVALTQRALVATAQGERISAGQLLDLARQEIVHGHLEAYPTSALTMAASARFELLHGHSPEAFEALGRAKALLPGLGRSLPWLAAQTRLQLAEAEVALRDVTAASTLLAEVDALLAGCPRLGILRRERDRLAAGIRSIPEAVDGRSVGLTAAELRLVPMLATHLSFREIGARFFLSRNTVKTQAISVYRKLGASSRSEAVARAHGLGLIEAGTADGDALIQTG